MTTMTSERGRAGKHWNFLCLVKICLPALYWCKVSREASKNKQWKFLSSQQLWRWKQVWCVGGTEKHRKTEIHADKPVPEPPCPKKKSYADWPGFKTGLARLTAWVTEWPFNTVRCTRRFSAYLTENTACFHYKQHLADSVQRNNCCLLSRLQRTPTYTV